MVDKYLIFIGFSKAHASHLRGLRTIEFSYCHRTNSLIFQNLFSNILGLGENLCQYIEYYHKRSYIYRK